MDTSAAEEKAANKLKAQHAMQGVHDEPLGQVSGPFVRALQKLVCLLALDGFNEQNGGDQMRQVDQEERVLEIFHELCLDMEHRREFFVGDAWNKFWDDMVQPAFTSLTPVYTLVKAGGLMHKEYASKDKPYTALSGASVLAFGKDMKKHLSVAFPRFESLPAPASGTSHRDQLDAFRDELFAESKGEGYRPGGHEAPQSWWWSFVYFGPFGVRQYNAQTLACLNLQLSDEDEGTSSRAESKRAKRSHVKERDQRVSKGEALLKVASAATESNRLQELDSVFQQNLSLIQLYSTLIAASEDEEEKNSYTLLRKDAVAAVSRLTAERSNAALGNFKGSKTAAAAGLDNTAAAAAAGWDGTAAAAASASSEPATPKRGGGTPSPKVVLKQKEKKEILRDEQGRALKKSGSPRKARVSKSPLSANVVLDLDKEDTV